jgi:hypothetical protein
LPEKQVEVVTTNTSKTKTSEKQAKKGKAAQG